MGRVLIIDSNKEFAERLANHINSEYPVLTAEICGEPDKAYKLIKDGKNDLLILDMEIGEGEGAKIYHFAMEEGIDKSRIVIISDKEPDTIRQFFPTGTCLAVLNKREPKQKEALDMVLTSIQRKAKLS